MDVATLDLYPVKKKSAKPNFMHFLPALLGSNKSPHSDEEP
jgi:hypothetical protein